MNNRLAPIVTSAAAVALLAGCSTASADPQTTSTAGSSAVSSESSDAKSATADDSATTSASDAATTEVTTQSGSASDALASKKEAHSVDEVDLSAAVDITLSGSSATTDADGVTVADGTVTITQAGTYRLSGDLAGQVVVEAGDDDKVALILDGATISSSSTAAIAVTNADEVTVVLADGSTNALSDGSSYGDGEDEPNATLWSSADLSITGTGSLDVTGNTNDAIASKDGLVIESGTITVDAVDDGIRGKDYLVITGGDITVVADGHALKSDNADDTTVGYIALLGGTVDVTSTADDGLNSQAIIVDGADLAVSAGDDGLHADADLTIGSGTITVTQSYEGIEGATILVAGGTIDVTASDDGFNASTGSGSTMGGGGMAADSGASIAITGGDITIDAEGDGFDSNGTATMSAGSMVIYGPTSNGNGAIDAAGGFTVTGGTVLAGGSSGMAETPEASSSQSFVAVTVNASAGDVLEISDSSGNVVATYTAEKTIQSLVASVAGMTAGDTYTVTLNGSASTTVTAGEGGMGGMGGGMGPGGNGGPGGGNRP